MVQFSGRAGTREKNKKTPRRENRGIRTSKSLKLLSEKKEVKVIAAAERRSKVVRLSHAGTSRKMRSQTCRITIVEDRKRNHDGRQICAWSKPHGKHAIDLLDHADEIERFLISFADMISDVSRPRKLGEGRGC